jgi:hypothetical protein
MGVSRLVLLCYWLSVLLLADAHRMYIGWLCVVYCVLAGFSQEVQQQFVCFVLDCYMMFVGHCYVVGRVVGRCLTCFVFVM